MKPSVTPSSPPQHEDHDDTLHHIECLEQLQRITSNLADAVTRTEVAKLIVEEGVKALGCPHGVINLLNSSGDALEPLYFVGYPEAIISRYVPIPLHFKSPVTDAFRTAEAIFLKDQASHLTHYPHIAGDWLASSVVSLTAVPLILGESVIGTLGFSYLAPHPFNSLEKMFLKTLAEECAKALQRTEHYEIERQAKERYQTLFNSLEVGYCVFSVIFDSTGHPIDYRFLEINPAFEKHTGLKDAVGKRAKELVPELEQHWIDRYGRVALTGESIRFEQHSVAMGRHFDVYAVRVGDKESRKIALIFNDITERKRIEENLRRSEDYFRTLAETLPGFVWMDSAGGVNEYMNVRWTEFTGQTPEDAHKYGWQKMTHPEDIPRIEQQWKKCRTTGQTYEIELRHRHKKGEYCWFLSKGLPLRNAQGQIVRWVGTSIDISARKEAEEALQKSEDRYRSLVKASSQIVWTADASGQIIEPLESWFEFTGQGWEEHQGDGWLSAIHPQDRERIKTSWHRAIKEKTFYFENERLRHHDGSYRYMDVRATPVFDHDGSVREWIGTHTDVTKRVVNDRLLEQQTRLLRNQTELLALANEAIIVRNRSDRIISWNKAATELYGYTETEALGQHIHQLLHTTFEGVPEDIAQVLHQSNFWEGEITQRHKQGERITLLSRQALRRDEQRQVLEIVEVNWDISARKQVEVEREKRLAFSRRSEKEALALAEIASSFSLAKPFETNLNSIAERVVKTTEAAACSIELFQPDGLSLRLSGSHGYPAKAMEMGFGEMYQNNVETLSQKALRTREVVMVRDYISWALSDQRRAPLHPFLEGLGWGTAVVMPLSSAVGAVNVFYKEGHDPDLTDLLQLSTIVSQIALVVENNRLFEEAQGKAALEERQRLARDLHDSVSQSLYGIRLGAQSAKDAIRSKIDERKLPALERSLEYLIHMADTANAEMKSLIFELRPDSLEKEGLVMALQKHLRALELRHRFQLHLDLAVEPDVSLKVKEVLYRITQEAMNNVVKHAQARHVWISLKINPPGLELSISDDGLGFDPSQEFIGHLGLRSMRERAESVGAQFTISSQNHNGTCVQVCLPLEVVSEI